MPRILALNPSTAAVSGGNSFGIIQPDSGTSPTATIATDTLTLTSAGSVTIAGNSATNTITLTVTGTNVGGFTSGSVIFAGASGTLAQDNAKFFWDGTNHTLGIGTTRSGAISATNPMSRVKGSGTTSATSSFEVQDSSANPLLFVRNDGLVLLGTNTDMGGGLLQVHGTTSGGYGANFSTTVDNTTNVFSIIDSSATSNSSQILFGIDGNGALTGFAGGVLAVYKNGSGNNYRLNIGTFGSAPVLFYTGFIEAMRIETDQKIGIGTSSPGAQLHVASKATSTISFIIRAVTSQSVNLLEIQNSSSSPLVVVDRFGQTGMGTSSPSEMLHVASGRILAGSAPTATTPSKVKMLVTDATDAFFGAALTSGELVFLECVNGQAGIDSFRYSASPGMIPLNIGGFNGGGNTLNLRFWTNNAEVMDITSAGLVGIGTTNPGSALEVKGIIASNAGTGTALAKHGGTISQNTTQLGNTAATETSLYSFSVVANSLAVNGDRVLFDYGGTFATSVNTDKQIKVKFGATTVLDTGALAITTAANWRVRGWVIRTGATTQKAFVEISTSSSVLVDTVSFTSPAETLSGAVTLVVTGKGTSASDVVFEAGFISWASAP